MKPVIMLRAGETAKIIAVRSHDDQHMRKLTVFGLLPGADIEVLQTAPVYVLRIDNTELALDYETAAGILVATTRAGR
ncbi:FeoA family protein [Sporomusa termitida]|uniref:FeoA domain protein n=1 Tax=Sporomusa termitida TaxID=2377 RepID=A0A517DSP4_9FIRM|nr:FeoA family protein [Sporomusa termitida]QDR80374.1 FeoA domain protein [Sporomusa termitida]